MEIIDINTGSGESFEQMWSIYDVSFPSHEKQTKEHLVELLEGSNSFRIDGFVEEGIVIGFFAYWLFEDLVYLEHFAIDQQNRCGGRGTAMLADFIARHSPATVVGEIEPPIDEVTCRRQALYNRAGFVEGQYFQFPAYNKGGENFEMIFISHGKSIDDDKFERYVRFLNDVVTDGN